MNALVGQKVAIVSDKPQTTRRDIRAVLTTDEYQVVFTDTPGFHKPRTLLGSRLNDLVGEADRRRGRHRAGRRRERRRRARATPTCSTGTCGGGGPAICAVNKLDLIRNRVRCRSSRPPPTWARSTRSCRSRPKTGRGVRVLLDLLVERLPEGPPLYPPDEVTDQPLEVRLAELVREQALATTRQEVPHSIAVVVEDLEEGRGSSEVHGDDRRRARLAEGHRDRQGRLDARDDRVAAREQIEELVLDPKVFLDLRVKVLKEWQRDPKALQRLGF